MMSLTTTTTTTITSCQKRVNPSSKQQQPPSQKSLKNALASTALAATFAFSSPIYIASPPPAFAIPQTSECATNACDDFDYHDQDLTQTYFTKGSLKRANFRGANLSGISLFGANLEDADFTGANLENANLGQCNLLNTNFTGANLTNAIVSGASNLETVKANDSDWSQVIIRKDVLMGICANVDGVSPVTGDPTAMTLECP
jgi:uncharacterized protein YjbI with pentapeptide repeats